ncbi:MAG: hypothetical protein LC131_07365 [Anaerolineae bacterium]|nr:hypothetical protein [Rhodocyclaceae bacterium]MCZ2113638.1 hypothetical protein [Anaerolineae bacterium]
MGLEKDQIKDDDVLVRFCLRQRECMDEQKWVDLACEIGHEKLGLVALILSSDTWYGHRDTLLRIAEKLGALHAHPKLRKCLDQGFNLPRFANKLRSTARRIEV